MKSRFELEGKKALVTGAAQGLGRAFARALAEAGADVAAVDMREDKLANAAEELRSTGRNILAITADTGGKSNIESMINTIISTWGRLDIAINNVGIAPPIKDSVDVTEAEWDKIIGVNLKGTFFCAQCEAKAMLPRRYGKIVNIASICGSIVWPEYQSLYSISKAGIIHMTRCLAVEWIKFGIRVNSLSPGVTRTPELNPEVIPVFQKKAPTGRVAEPGDLLGALLYLVSDASDFMVGRDLVVDGGYTLL